MSMEILTTFDELNHAIEEAEFLSRTTNIAYSIVAIPNQDASVAGYMVMEKSRALATASVILESFLPVDGGATVVSH